MARKAFVSSDMAHDEKLYDLSEKCPEAVLMWPWIVTWFDDWGRALASPKRIKSQMFPNLPLVSVDLIAIAIESYAEVGLVERYSDAQHEYMAIPMDKWFRWQTHIRRDKRINDGSKFPPCPTDSAHLRDNARSNAKVREDDCEQRADHDPSTLPPYDPSPTPTKYSGGGVIGPSELEVRIQKHYERTFGLLPNDVQISKLSLWCERGMEEDVVFTAIVKARERGKDFGYILGILEKQFARGIRTITQAESDETQRQTAVGGASSGSTNNRPNQTRTVNDADRIVPKGKFGRV